MLIDLFRWRSDHSRPATKYVRDHWPEGIRITVSPQFLLTNDRTAMSPQHYWKYEIQLDLLIDTYFKVTERNFKWTMDEDVRKSRGPGLLIRNEVEMIFRKKAS